MEDNILQSDYPGAKRNRNLIYYTDIIQELY